MKNPTIFKGATQAVHPAPKGVVGVTLIYSHPLFNNNKIKEVSTGIKVDHPPGVIFVITVGMVPEDFKDPLMGWVVRVQTPVAGAEGIEDRPWAIGATTEEVVDVEGDEKNLFPMVYSHILCKTAHQKYQVFSPTIKKIYLNLEVQCCTFYW